MADKTPARQSLMDALDGGTIADAVYQGLTLGFGDEIDAALNASVRAPFSDDSWSSLYDKTLDDGRKHNKRFEEGHPVQDVVGKVVGTFMIPSGAGAAVSAKGLPLAEKLERYYNAAMKGSKYGAGFGAAAGFGRGEGDGARLHGAVGGARVGSVLRAAVPGRGLATRAFRKGIRAEANEVYKRITGEDKKS